MLHASKRVGLLVGAVLVIYGLLEVAVFLLYRPTVSLPIAEAAPADSLITPADSVTTPDVKTGREKAGLGFRDPGMCVHPYLGYVFLPFEERDTDPHPGINISVDGFLDPKPVVRARREGALIVGVMGGSVAGQLGTWHAQLLEDALQRQPAFRDLELDFVWLGMPGYHQPQQLIQLSYILAQGGELDVLINIDGFNEVAVPAVLNAPHGAHPLFPMNWSMVALDVPDPRVRRNVGGVSYLREERYTRQERFASSFWSNSPIATLVRQRDDEKLQRQIAYLGWELQEFPSEEVPWFVRGPERLHGEMETMVPELVAVWVRCSLQMDAICKANGIRYLHVLQPNQYDPGSKPLSSEENEKAFDVEGPYKPAIEMGYPMLRAAGDRLCAAGVAFHDMSMIFDDVGETLYVDTCCHFNKEGNRIMVEKIGEVVNDMF